MKLRTADGMQLSYALQGSDFQCTEIKDRNGNYITINYTNFARVDTVVDTLNRTIKFNYDATNALTSITQTWTVNGSAVTHTWAAFEYRNPNLTISTNFTGLATVGAYNGSTLKVLSRVILADNSRYEFNYTSWGQVWKISQIAGDGQTLLNYRSYNLPLDSTSAQTDCPRFTQRRDWAKYWNQDAGGTEQEAITSFIVPVSTSWTMPAPDGSTQSGLMCQVTLPDGTYHKMYSHSSGWDKGLLLLTETYDNSQTRQRQLTTAWTQDDTGLTVPLNPRVAEANTYDPAGNRKRTRFTYQQISLQDGTACSLPQDVFEYQANATTVLRSTRTTYNTNSAYTSRRIIGLMSQQALYDGDVTAGGVLATKLSYQYDETGSIQGTDAPVQHDNTNYGGSFVTGRANLSSVKRYDVNDSTQTAATTTSTKYNTAGAVVSSTDASNHVTQFSYVDSFSDNVARNTLAYPTKATDPDGYYSTAKYNFDFGAVTYRQTPPPNYNGAPSSQPAGPEQTVAYDPIGRVQQVTTQVNSAYTRYVYSNTMTRVDTYATIQEGLGEAHSFQITDGAGRVIAKAMDHPGSTGGYSGQRFVYDVMGRAFKTSNPTETSAIGAPPQWATTGDDAAAGWIYTQQTYDWKGRPLVTTNQDGTTKIASYSGCGCAGGEAVTLTDEGTIDAGVAKRRQQKIYSDVLGRTVKTEILNWEGGTPYSTSVNSYNARDQITQTRTYAGAEGGGVYQDTTFTYDGYARLRTQHRPEQQVDPNNSASTDHTTWDYNSDDTIQKITDARGASASYTYNGRHLERTIVYIAPSPIPATPSVTYEYDAAGNRISMSDASGTVSYGYDQLSRLLTETRHINALWNSPTGGNYLLTYDYNLDDSIKKVIDPFGATIEYNRDPVGRLIGVTGSPFAGVTQYVTNVQYRAWGAVKIASYRDDTATIQYNSRLLPTQFQVTNNAYGFASTRENYSYFADRRISGLTDLNDTAGTSPPFTMRYLSRVYAYDQVGRVIDNHGPNGLPLRQSYGYDAFGNMQGRWGTYYFQGFRSQTASYVNNRRTDWSYDAEGQVTNVPASDTDAANTFTYDAAGRLVTRVETTSTGTTTFSPTYDGDGEAISAVTTPSGSASIVGYDIRSSVFGEVLTELDQSGNKRSTHIQADGLLFASQAINQGGFVQETIRNPVGTGERDWAIYDPLGNYIPFQHYNDPRPPAGSYNSGSMSSLAASQANPDSYGVGCMLDGVPTTCNRVLRANNGIASKLILYGPSPDVALANMGLFLVEHPESPSRPTRPPSWRPPRRNPSPGNPDPFNIGKNEIDWVYSLFGFYQPQNPRPDLPDWVRDFYKKHQGQIDRCINRIFGQLWNGTPDIAARVMERQTIKNAPELDVSISQFYLGAYTGTDDTQGTFSLASKLGHGTIYIASNLYATISQDERNRTYFHELGNILAAKITGDIKGSHFGNPNGIGKKKDPDTGARLENCIFGSVPF